MPQRSAARCRALASSGLWLWSSANPCAPREPAPVGGVRGEVSRAAGSGGFGATPARADRGRRAGAGRRGVSCGAGEHSSRQAVPTPERLLGRP